MLVAIGYRIGPEHFPWIALLQYLPYPIHLAPALVAVLCSLRLNRGWRAAALLSLLLVLGPVMGLVLQRGEPDEGRLRLRVMTYNIKAHLALQRRDGFLQLAREIEAQDPDILLVQDASEPGSARPFPQSAGHATSAPVAALFGSRHRYQHGQFGIASRYPLHDCAPGPVRAGVQSESYIRCVADVNGLAVELFSVHLQTPRHALNATRREPLEGVDDLEQNAAVRLAQAAELAETIRASRGAVIVGGDLNAPQPSLVIQRLLNEGLRDAFASAGFGYGYTYGQALRPGFAFLRLDHVLVGPGIGVAGSHVGGARASEHQPVIADLLLRPSVGS